MGEPVLVRVGDVQFLAEVREGGGPTTVGLDDAFSFDGVRQTVEAVACELARAWEAARPDKASVEFSLSLSAQPGKLVGLLVDGAGQASLKVSLTWCAKPDDDKPGGDKRADLGEDEQA